jgi:hypothetical protein
VTDTLQLAGLALLSAMVGASALLIVFVALGELIARRARRRRRRGLAAEREAAERVAAMNGRPHSEAILQRATRRS